MKRRQDDSVDSVDHGRRVGGRHAWIAALTATALVWAAFAVVREELIPFNASAERRDVLLTGDEPEYLLAAWSLAHDGDMNLYNDVQEKTWEAFQDRPVCGPDHGGLAYFQRVSSRMKDADPETWRDKLLMVHRPGTSALLAPAAWSAARTRWWAYLIMSTLAALGAGALLLGAARAEVPLASATVLCILFVLSPPGLFYANQAFPEMPMAVFVALAVVLLFNPSPWSVCTAAVCAMTAPWFADRAIPASGLIGIACVLLARNTRTRAIVMTILVCGALLLAYHYFCRFRVPIPLDHSPRGKTTLANAPMGLLLVLLDREWGIVWLCPALVLCPVAFVKWWSSRRDRLLCACTALAMVAVIVAVASSHGRGGVCPKGRYGVLVQWMAIPVFLAWCRAGMNGPQKILVLLPLLAGLFEGAVLFGHPNWWYRSYHPIFAHPAIQPWYALLPDIQEPAAADALKAVIWLTLMAVYATAAADPMLFRSAWSKLAAAIRRSP